MKLTRTDCVFGSTMFILAFLMTTIFLVTICPCPTSVDIPHPINVEWELTKQPEPINLDDLACITQAIYFEGRSEPIEGQVAIGEVIMSRVKSKHYPDSVCDVVHQRLQFTYYWDGKKEVVTDEKAWRTAADVGSAVLKQNHTPSVYGANHYHTTQVSPYWADESRIVKVIGNHVFYEM